MRSTDKVLRALADAALVDRRSWSSVGALAREAGVGDKLAYKALGRPAEIGAVTKHRGGGFSVTDPERILALFSARRSLAGARNTTVSAVQSLLPTVSQYAIGGTRAAAYRLGGDATIADHAPAIGHVSTDINTDELPVGEGALVCTADARTLHSWADGYTSSAQTYADLFAQPGWQASEFRRALWRQWFAVDDWARAEATRG